MTRLVCGNCGLLNPIHARYRACGNCKRLLFDAAEIDI